MSFWHELGIAISLLLIFEGMLPFLAPQAWRKMVLTMIQENDHTLRMSGLMLMGVGLALLYLVN